MDDGVDAAETAEGSGIAETDGMDNEAIVARVVFAHFAFFAFLPAFLAAFLAAFFPAFLPFLPPGMVPLVALAIVPFKHGGGGGALGALGALGEAAAAPTALTAGPTLRPNRAPRPVFFFAAAVAPVIAAATPPFFPLPVFAVVAVVAAAVLAFLRTPPLTAFAGLLVFALAQSAV